MGGPIEMDGSPAAPDRRRSRGVRRLLATACLFLAALFVALGLWQLQRRAWKLDLIARVVARVHAEPTPPPGPAEWPRVTADTDEYRRVRVAGRFASGRAVLVQAVTVEGPGFWVMAPFTTEFGWILLVNRGFVPGDQRTTAGGGPPDDPPPPSGPTSVTGLLRMSEPGGAFLRSNDPASGRWYSRDVKAIAAAQDWGPVAPFFVDADDTPNPAGWPRGGLTVVAFYNAHLVYALTWLALALLAAGAACTVLRARR